MNSNSFVLGPLDHVGVAVNSISEALEAYERTLGASAEPETFEDELQQVRIRFALIGGVRYELIEPLGAASHLHSLLRRGVGLYHTCHEVERLDEAVTTATRAGAILASPPKPAVAFDGRRVAFLMMKGLMVELLEASHDSQQQ